MASAAVTALTGRQLDQLAIDTLRVLSSGAEPTPGGVPSGPSSALAALVYTLWNRVMNFDPEDPLWPNRDRFVLSDEGASMLLWSVLHLGVIRAVNADYEQLGQPAVTLEDVRRLRQDGRKAPGHRHHRRVSGMETTVGPCGEGAAASVGMAIAEKWLAERYNRPGFDVFDYRIYALCGTGCLTVDVAVDAAALAGRLGLDNLCWVFVNDQVAGEGAATPAFAEDVTSRFNAHGWNVVRVGDTDDLERGLDAFRTSCRRPTLLVVGAEPRFESSAPVEAQGLQGLPVPEPVYEHFAHGIGRRGAAAHGRWTELFATYRERFPGLADEVVHMHRAELPAGWDRDLPVFEPEANDFTGPEVSDRAIRALMQNVPWLLGAEVCSGSSAHTVAAIMNGLALSKVRPVGSFTGGDDVRAAVQSSARMELAPIFVLTDGTASVALPSDVGLVTLEPGDANEVVEACRYALQIQRRPAAIVLDAQPLPTLDRRRYAPAAGVARGGYVLADPAQGEPEIILIAAGGTLHKAVAAHERLAAGGIRSRLVSMPSSDVFELQCDNYRNRTLPPAVTARVAVVRGAEPRWERYVGATGRVIDLGTYGASPPPASPRRAEFEVEDLLATVVQLLEGTQAQNRQ